MSGKGQACAHVLAKRGYVAAQAVALFDDDNDLPMAERCGVSMLTQCTHGAVAAAAAAHPEWVKATRHGPLAAEEVLERVLALMREADEADAAEAAEAAATGTRAC
jgi:3-deoxy-D-manno-octulosonate 8-phosphate phosphatase KdsC-like HAD superfamily phosphatase